MQKDAHPAPTSAEITTDDQELQAISIRLPKRLIEAYKLVASHHGTGYQPLMRDTLQRAVPELLHTAK